MAESLHCASEVITLLIGQTPIQNGFGVKKIKLKLEKKTQGAGSTAFLLEALGENRFPAISKLSLLLGL